MTEPHPIDQALNHDGPTEDLADGGTWMLDLVSAVEFLRRGDRHGITVWDALEEALRWWIAEQLSLTEGSPDPTGAEPAWGDPDPLRTTMRQLLAVVSTDETAQLDLVYQQAVRRWTEAMADRHNEGQPWPHPTTIRPFPPSRW